MAKREITYLIALLLCFMGSTGFATTYYYQSGTFTTASNWNSNPAGGGSSPSAFTNSADIWVIRTALTLNAAWTVAGQLKIGDGTTTNTVTISTNPTITGGITVRSGATLLQNVASTATSPNMATTQDATSTINFGSTTAHTIPAITFGNVIFSSSSASGAFSAGTTTIAGDFSQSAGTVTIGSTASTSYTVNVSGNFSMSGSAKMVMASSPSASVTITVTGTTTITSSTATILNFQSATATTGVSVFQANGNVTISGGGTNMIEWGSGAIGSNMFGVKGNLTISGTKLINTSSLSTAAIGFVFNGTGTVQTLSNTSTGSAASTECAYQVNSGAYVRLAANLSLGTGTTIHSDMTVLSGGILDCATYVISGGSTGGGGVQIPSGARLITANTGGINATITATGLAFNGGANYEFNGSSAQVTGTSMPAAIVSPGSVTISNSAGVTLSQATSFASGDTLNLENGTFTNGTNLTMSSGSYLVRDNGTLSATPSTYSGVNLVYANLGNNASAITTANEFPASFTGNVTVNKTGATITLNNAKSLTGALTLTAGALDASSSNYNISLTGNWTNNSGSAAFVPRLAVVTMNGSGSQTISGSSSTSFNDLTINNSAGVTLSVATTFAAGDTLSLQNGTFTNGTNLSMSSGSYLIRDNGTLSATPSTYSGVNLIYANLGNNSLTLTAGNEFPASFTGNVTLNKSLATISLNNTKTITGDITLTAGILDATASNYGISLTGNWANNASVVAFVARSGTVTFNGSVAQSIGGSTTTSFYNLTNSNTGAALSVNTNTNVSGTLNMNGANTLLTPGASVVFNSSSAAGTISGSGTIQVTRTASTADYVNQYKFTTNTLTGMTVEYAGSGAQTINSTVGNYGSLETSGSGTKTLAGAIVVNNDVTIGSSTVLDVSSSNYQMTVSGGWTNSGTFTAQNGTVLFNATTTGKTLSGTMTGTSKFNVLTFNGSGGAWSFGSSAADVGSTFTITTGTVTAPSSTLQVAGNWSNSGTFTHNSGTVTLNGTASQSIGGSSTTSFNNLTNSNTVATVSVNTNANVAGTLSLNGSATVLSPAATIVFNSAAAAGTISGNGTIQVTRTASTADYVNQYKFSTNTLTSMTVDYAGTGAQTINSTVGNYGALKTSGSGTKTLAGAVVVNNDLTIGSSTVLDVSTSNYQMTVGGSWTNSGTFTAQNGTVVFNATSTGKTVTGTLTGTSRFSNLTFNGSGGAWSFGSNAADVGGNFIITAGTVTAPSSTLQVAGNWSNGGTFTHNSGTVVMNTTSTGKTLSGSMTGSNKFYALTFNGSGGAWSFGANSADAGNNFTITAGTVTAPSTTLQVAGNWSNSGTFTHNSGLVTLNKTGAQTIGGSSATAFNSLTIGSGSVTTVSTSGQTIKSILQCNDTLNAGGYLTLLSTATQTALIDGSGTGKVLGNVTMQRYLDSSYGYRYISSPFQAATLGQLSGSISLSATFPNFYGYNENVNYAGWEIDTAVANTLDPMYGYAANFGSSFASSTYSLTGVVNNGSMSRTLYNHNQTYTLGFNLVGNPYPSPIDWTASSGWTKTNIDNAIYFFNHGDTNQYYGRYSSYISGVSSDGIASNIIPAMQGFFVHVSSGSYPVTGTLASTNAVRTTGLTPHYYRQTAGSRPLVRISADFSDVDSDPAVVYFDDNATVSFDPEFDALKLLNTDNNVPSFYSVSGDETNLSIQGLPALTDSQRLVPLGLRTEKDGMITFNARSVENIPAGMHVWFYDIATGKSQDMNVSPKFPVQLAAGKYENRFFLFFSKADTLKLPGLNGGLNAYTSGGSLFVYLPFGKGDLVITNMAGQMVGRKELTGTGFHEVNMQLGSGIYIATLYSGLGKQSKRVFLGH